MPFIACFQGEVTPRCGFERRRREGCWLGLRRELAGATVLCSSIQSGGAWCAGAESTATCWAEPEVLGPFDAGVGSLHSLYRSTIVWDVYILQRWGCKVEL